jgi:hypothetical protein
MYFFFCMLYAVSAADLTVSVFQQLSRTTACLISSIVIGSVVFTVIIIVIGIYAFPASCE